LAVLHIENCVDITSSYQWQFNHVPLPQNNQLVIYELHVAEFARVGNKAGTFLSLIKKLDYLQDLGVNAIELMPIMAFGSAQSWGYNPRHACAPEPSYGTPQNFKRLVDACHKRGIQV
jgi:1,4-alpha-glucan branching enzyme